ncbi:MAG: hypothetical protein H7343_13520 [Undibacterium sp.]|nr:hypothetical protein [Opitutaceae bacterium]
MKKTFPLSVTGIDSPRVIEAIKHDARKYVKRERRKTIPEGTDFWDFACKVGASRDTAETKRIDEVNPAIDAVVLSGAAEIYLEIFAVSGKHIRHPAAPLPPVGAPAADAQIAPPPSDPAP